MRSLRFEAPTWLDRDLPFEVVAPVKVWADAFRQGRLKLIKGFHKEPVTIHDSCNFVRNGGYMEDVRILLRHICADLREMDPTGVHGYCCGNGGGHVQMPEYKQLRLASTKVKAEQIKATGAHKIVVTCHNCEDGIKDCVKHWGVEGEVVLMSEFLAEAIDLEASLGEQAPETGEE